MLDKIGFKWFIFFAGLILLLSGGDLWLKPDPAPVAPAFAYDNLIRLHVIANGDSTEDQNLKLKVRDRVLESLQPLISQANSVEEARSLILNNLSQIQGIAGEEARQSGIDWPVQAEIASYQFPAKSYGDLILPAGTYEALRISIGRGEGQNWWCVLFPPLCFVNVSGGPALGNSQWFENGEDTSPVMAPLAEEAQRVSSPNQVNNLIPEPQIRFRFLDWWSR